MYTYIYTYIYIHTCIHKTTVQNGKPPIGVTWDPKRHRLEEEATFTSGDGAPRPTVPWLMLPKYTTHVDYFMKPRLDFCYHYGSQEFWFTNCYLRFHDKGSTGHCALARLISWLFQIPKHRNVCLFT